MRKVDLREIAHVTDSRIHGKGVFASRTIAKGEYIGAFHGPEVRRDGIHVLWVYEGEADDRPIGRSGRNLLRYLNHASRCSAEFSGFDLYARRANRRDDEITIHYEDAE